MKPVVVYHPKYQAYDFGPEHPFRPTRLAMLTDLLEALGHAPSCVSPSPAVRDDLLTVHDATFVDHVEAASAGRPRAGVRQYGLDTADVPIFSGMDEAARYLVGGTLHAARLVAGGDADTVLQLGGGLHHAQCALAAGFCIYNDLSVAIHYLREQGLRVAYLDVDVHHGDGVQWLHYEDPSVLTLSLHESGRYLYPGSGGVHELGKHAGRGYSLNVPLEPFTENASYLETFERVVPFALSWFRPDVLVVQCGADAHAADPLADLMLTTHAYETLFRRITELAAEFTGGRAVITLGGGYDLDATVRIWALLYLILHDYDLPDTLPERWRERWEKRLGITLSASLHDPEPDFDIPRRSTIEQQNRLVSTRLLEMAVPYWYG